MNVEAWIAEKVSDKFARTEATSFISGNGVGKPRGILTYASGTSFNQVEQVVSGSAALLLPDGLISLVYALKAPYKVGAQFLMKRATVSAIRKFKDTTNQYLWQPSVQAGQPDSLLGFPIMEADDMEAVAANALAVAFGNFKAAYQIVDRIGIRTLRDPYSSKPYVEFYTTKRVGGGVKNFEAFKIQKCST
jgi:HK97 family phage major capsid protein